MTKLNINYVTWVRRGIRGHGSGYKHVPQLPSSNYITSDGTISDHSDFPNQISNFTLAFISTTTNDASGVVTFPDNTSDTNMTINVNTNDSVTVTAVYIDTSGLGTGGPAIFIDAFNETRGNFSNVATFVNIYPDASLTIDANAQGIVPTSMAEDIEALPSITDPIYSTTQNPPLEFDDNLVFDYWHVISGMELISGDDLHAALHSSAIAFAFYKEPEGNNSALKVPGPLRFKIPLILHKAEEFIRDQIEILGDAIQEEAKAIKNVINSEK